MNVNRTKKRIRSALAFQPEARVRQGMIVGAGWAIIDQPGHDGVSLTVHYKHPGGGSDATERELVAGWLRVLSPALENDFRVEGHAGNVRPPCPTGLLGRHIHIMDK